MTKNAWINQIGQLLADERFESLKRSQMTVNSFDISRVTERRHSDMLAWLLDPHEGHALGDAFLRRLMREGYNEAHSKSVGAAIKTFGDLGAGWLHAASLSQAIVLTELGGDGRIDILILDPVAEIVVAIENKYGAKESKDQLRRYEKWVNETFNEFSKFYIVLDAYGEDIDRQSPWIGLTYDWIVDFLKKVTSYPEMSERVRILLEDYLACVREEEPDKWHLYDHSSAVDLFADYRELFNDPDLREVIQQASRRQYDWEKLNKDWGSLGLAEIYAVYRYIYVFETLIGFHDFEPIKVELEKLDNSGEVELYRSVVSYLPGEWTIWSDACEAWPLYFNLEESPDHNPGEAYDVVLKIRKHLCGGQEESLKKVIQVAQTYGKEKIDKEANVRLYTKIEGPRNLAAALRKAAQRVNEKAGL